MRRMVLVGTACVAAAALAPVAQANAERPLGKCTIKGIAIFNPVSLTVVPTSNLGYEFVGTAACETTGGEPRTGNVYVKGAETLSCAGALGETEGKGTFTVGGVKFPFGLTFLTGAPGSTTLIVKFADGGVAVGSANFLKSEEELAYRCFAAGGAHELEFVGAAAGEL